MGEDENIEQANIESMSIKDFTITDEFIPVDQMISCRDLAKKLMEVPKGVVFAMDEEGNAVGAVTAREFLIATMEGKNLKELLAKDIMNTNIMEIMMDDPISEVIFNISKFAPYAVVVKDTDGSFKGYFSPKDYQEALKKTGVM